jgi:hypothetical protein
MFNPKTGELMNKIKFTALFAVMAFLIFSCSLIDNLKEKLGSSDKKEEEKKEETVEQETSSGATQNDIQYYNKYIDVLNKISEAVERFHKAYLSDVPDPKTIKKESMIFVISSDVYEMQMESELKNYNRSLFDNGELAKLNADNKQMKQEIEADFKEVLTALGDYEKLSREVVNYYKNKGYQKDLSLADGYDEKMKNEYDRYKAAYDKFNATVKKYKPKMTRQDPDKIHDPGKKSVAVLMNAYENTLDGAEAFYDKFQLLNKDSSTTELSSMIDSIETKFKEDTKKVESTEFTDQTKFMKYNFQDYFTKTVNDFISESRKFFENMNKKKMDEKSFNAGYDNVINYYNYMINAYNSSIGTVNQFSNF